MESLRASRWPRPAPSHDPWPWGWGTIVLPFKEGLFLAAQDAANEELVALDFEESVQCTPRAVPVPRVGAAIFPRVLLRLPQVGPGDAVNGAALRGSRRNGTAVVGGDSDDNGDLAWAAHVPSLRHVTKGISLDKYSTFL